MIRLVVRGDYEVGKLYRVPCLRATKDNSYGSRGWVPIIGPEHADAEFLNFPYMHWHIDWRFAADSVFKKTTVRDESYCYAAVTERWAYGRPEYNHPMVTGEPVMRRMKCRRVWPAYPRARAMLVWLPKLEAARQIPNTPEGSKRC